MDVTLRGVSVHRGGTRVLDRVDLDVTTAERLVVLGDSGSGKTTLLRVVAGVQAVDEGHVGFGGRDVTDLPPRERDVAMVDQDASLQPHLDVHRNVGFPLSIRGVGDPELDERVTAEARVFSLGRLLRRRPRQLSAGQRHDVALARSLVRRVGVLLYDEPFARIDPHRRASLLGELIRVQEGYGVTLVAATNDQRVAMSLAHRCAVLHAGRIVQVGEPTHLHARPGDLTVARALGAPPMNLLAGRIERASSGVRVRAGPLRIVSFAPAVADLLGSSVTVGIRPTDLRRATAADGTILDEVIHRATDLGAEVEVDVGDATGRLTARIERPAPPVGSLLQLAVDPATVHLFGSDGRAVAHGV